MGEEFFFENLEVYKKAAEIVHEVYSITKGFPDNEIFGLTNQVRRAVVSIPLNIAEGSARSKKEFQHFLDIARGSVFEALAVMQLAVGEHYISLDKYRELKQKLAIISKMINGLKRSLSK
ncbi:MAG: four helix bundle protein [Endomicrobiales bacterium]|nr:four helix bundle protein [Endomicrobiales bacterium]